MKRIALPLLPLLLLAVMACNGGNQSSSSTDVPVVTVPSATVSDFNDGFDSISIDSLGNDYVFAVTIDENVYGTSVEEMFRYANIPVSDLINDIGCDAETQQLFSTLKTARANLIIRYIGKQSGTHHDFVIPYTEL